MVDWGQWYEESEHPRGPGGKWREKGGKQQPTDVGAVIKKFTQGQGLVGAHLSEPERQALKTWAQTQPRSTVPVYRGIWVDDVRPWDKGAKVTMKALSSFSEDSIRVHAYGEGGAWFLELKVPPGHTVNIAQYSTYPQEQEHILPEDTVFVVKERRRPGDGGYFEVDLEPEPAIVPEVMRYAPGPTLEDAPLPAQSLILNTPLRNNIEVLINPTEHDVRDLVRGQGMKQVRVLKDKRNNVYVFDARMAIHKDVREGLSQLSSGRVRFKDYIGLWDVNKRNFGKASASTLFVGRENAARTSLKYAPRLHEAGLSGEAGPSEEAEDELNRQHQINDHFIERYGQQRVDMPRGTEEYSKLNKTRDSHILLNDIIEDDLEAHKHPGPYSRTVFKYEKDEKGRFVAAIEYELRPDKVQINDLTSLQKGLGAKMLTAALEHAKRKGITQAKLYALEGAVPFYQKFGFERLNPDSTIMTMDLTSTKRVLHKREAAEEDDVGPLAKTPPKGWAEEEKPKKTRRLSEHASMAFRNQLSDRANRMADEAGYKGDLELKDFSDDGSFGEYYPAESYKGTGKLVLYADDLQGLKQKAVDGVIAHELSHDKFVKVTGAWEGEGKFKKELDPYLKDLNGPTVQKLAATGPRVSPYAQEFWESIDKANKISGPVLLQDYRLKGLIRREIQDKVTRMAIAETLAEIANVRALGRGKQVPKEWDDLYDVIDSCYKELK